MSARQSEARRASALRMWQDPEIRARIVAASTAAHSTPEARAEARERSLRLMQDPERRAKAIAALNAPGVAEKRIAGIRAGHAKRRELLAIEEERAKFAAHYGTPEVRATFSERAKAQWADPAYRAKQKAAAASPKVKATRSEAQRKRYAKAPKPAVPKVYPQELNWPTQTRASAGADVLSTLPMDPFERRLFGVAIPQTRAAACEERSESARDAVQAVG